MATGVVAGTVAGLRQAHSEERNPWTGNFKLDREPLPDYVFSSKAPVEGNMPGRTESSGVYVNDKGRVEPWNAKYDQYGMQIERTDFNAGNMKQNIPSTHYHTKTYLPKGQIYRVDHIPGIGPKTNWVNPYIQLKIKF